MANQSKPTVSVLVATYNGAQFIQAQLASLTAQTVLPVEVVVTDDVSSDDTLLEVERFAASSSVPVTIQKNLENKGYSRNFLDGLSFCRGDYVAFCDQDDVWLPEKIETILEALSSQPEVGLVFSDCELVDHDLKPIGQTATQYLGLTPSQIQAIKQGRLFEILLRKPCVTGMTMVCHRRKLMHVNHHFLSMAHDYALSFAFAAMRDYVYIDRSLVKYRQHNHNVVGMAAHAKVAELVPVEQALNELNTDLVDKINLCVYAKQMVVSHQPEHFEMIEKLTHLMDFFSLRIERRQSIVAWRHNFSAVALKQFDWLELYQMWLKDFKVFVKSKWLSRMLNQNVS